MAHDRLEKDNNEDRSVTPEELEADREGILDGMPEATD